MDHTLKLLKQMAHGIAKQFGTSCEVVIHDLNKDLETSIVHIENGQVTNRKSGDGPSGIVLETLHKNAAKVQDKLSYLTRTEDGRILKSSTLYIRDADEKISYIFSINYDITALLRQCTGVASSYRTGNRYLHSQQAALAADDHTQCRRAVKRSDAAGRGTGRKTGGFNDQGR